MESIEFIGVFSYDYDGNTWIVDKENLDKILSYNPSAYYEQHYVYNKDGKYGLAIDYYQKALNLKPGDYKILCNLGTAYYNNKDNTNAIANWDKALNSNPDDVIIHYNLSQAYSAQNNMDKAIEELENVLLINPDFKDARKTLGYYYIRKGNIKEGITNCYKAFTLK